MLPFLHLTPHTMCFQIYTNTAFYVYIFSDPLVKINVTMWDLGHLIPFEPQNILINSVVSEREWGFLNLNKCTVMTTLCPSHSYSTGVGLSVKPHSEPPCWLIGCVSSFPERWGDLTEHICCGAIVSRLCTAFVCFSVLISPLSISFISLLQLSVMQSRPRVNDRGHLGVSVCLLL